MRLPAALALSLAVLPLAASGATPAPKGVWWGKLRPAEGLEISFAVRVEAAGKGLGGSLLNGPSALPFTSVSWNGVSLAMELAHLDAQLVATRDGDGMTGTWTRATASGPVSAPFTLSRSVPRVPGGGRSIKGDWAVEVGEGEKTERVLGIFRQSGGSVSGTFLDPSGDWGPYHGSWDGTTLVLQVFDGIHASRFDLAADQGGTLTGTYRPRSGVASRVAARRLSKAEASVYLPDSFGVTRPKDRTGPFRFSLSDADGRIVSLADEAYASRPVVVVIAGTWCPNCNDEAPALRELFQKYRGKGLQIVSLFYEYTGDVERSRRQLKRFAERYGITWPLLLAGTTKDARSSGPLQQIEGFAGYPTTLFLDRSHRIVKVHAGFDGPATGSRFTAAKRDLEAAARQILR